jgi:hypothetical protein
MQHLVNNQKEKDLRIMDQALTINKLISSDQSAKVYKKSFENLLLLASAYSDRYDGKPHLERCSLPNHLELGGTPLAETIVLLRDRAIDFRRQHNIEVLNTLFLTDGGNTGTLEIGNTPSYRHNGQKDSIVIKEGGITTVASSNSKIWTKRWSDLGCEAALKHFDETTGSRTINYYLTNSSKSDLRWMFYNLHGYDDIKFDKQYKDEWLKDGFLQLDGLNGFKSAYVLRAKDLGNVEDLEVNGDKKNDLVRGFRKFQKSKSTSRKFLGKFIEKIA